MEKQYYDVEEKLKKNSYFTTEKNNLLVLEFCQAKLNGGYGRLSFKKDVIIITLLKKIRNLKTLETIVPKDFDKYTEQDIAYLKKGFNQDLFKKKQTYVLRDKTNKNKVIGFEIKNTNKNFSYRTKQDIIINFKEFYTFLIEYIYQTSNKKIILEDITKFLRIQEPSDFNVVSVNFINDQELNVLLNNIRNRDFKALVQLSIMSGARPIEVLNIKIGRKHNLYKNNENKWVIHLPKFKRMSYAKYPIIIDMFEEELYHYFNRISKNLKDGEIVFKITQATFTRLMKHYTTKYLNKHYSPKILRKTARMIRSNAGYSHDWINKLMGHSPNSRIQAHYTNYAGIESDDLANEKLKDRLNPSLKEEHNKLKLQLQAQEEKIKEYEEIKKNQDNMQKILNLILEGKINSNDEITKITKDSEGSIDLIKKALQIKKGN